MKEPSPVRVRGRRQRKEKSQPRRENGAQNLPPAYRINPRKHLASLSLQNHSRYVYSGRLQ